MEKKFIGTIYQTLGNNRVKFSTKPGGNVNAGELVEMILSETNEKFLGRVTAVERRNYLIDLDGSVQLSSLYDSERVTEVSDVGVSGNLKDYLIGEVQIIGKRISEDKTFFRKPSSPFYIGDKIFTADKNFLLEQLKIPGHSIIIGNYRNNKDVPIYVDYDELISKHFCVLAMTGSGKSWTVAVLVEQIAQTGLPIIIFDPHGE